MTKNAAKKKTTQGLGWLPLTLIVLSVSLGGMAQTGMNTAIPQVIADTGISVGLSQWLATAFQLSLGIAMPTVAFLSKRLSAKSLFIATAGLFSVGSIVLAVANSFEMMIVGRVLEGVAAGIQTPLMQVVVFERYPRERWGTIMGFAGIAMGFSPNIGPTLTGVFISAWGWRSVFWFFAAFTATLAVLLALILESDAASGEGEKLDILSLLLSTVGFGGLLLGIANASDSGIASPLSFVPLGIGVVLVAAFVVRELRIPNPLLSMEVFRDRDFTLGTIMGCLLFSAFIGMTLVIPFGLQQVQGFSALEAGMVLLPGTVTALIINPVSGILYDRVGARAVVIAGGIFLLVGTLGMLDLGHATDLYVLMAWQLLRAFGISALIQPLMTWSVRRLRGKLIADGTSVTNTFRQIAAATGTAISVLLMASGGEIGVVTAAGVNAAVLFSTVCTAVMAVMIVILVKK